MDHTQTAILPGCHHPSLCSTSTRDVSFAWGGGPLTLLDLLASKPATRALAEHEAWAILCQSVQALQDLFLSDGISCKQCLPLVTPATLELSSRGKVHLRLVWVAAALENRKADAIDYLAPEYRHGRKCTDTDNEKMWIFSLGETLKRATITSSISTELCQVIADMSRTHISTRASLMYLLDVISDYCRRRQLGRPFSHVVMDLHQEAMAAMEAAQEKSENGGPPTMMKLRAPRANRCDPIREPLLPPLTRSVSRNWPGLQGHARCCTCEEATSMDDMDAAQLRRCDISAIHHRHQQARPKSICVPPGRYEWYQGGAVKLFRQGASNKENDELSRPLTYDRAVPSPTVPASLRPVSRPLHRRRVGGAALQRAASRLYRAGEATPNLRGAEKSIGPEFVVKAALPVGSVTLGAGRASVVTVILLDGQRVEVSCDVNRTTAGQLFEMIVEYEHLEDNFMLGLSALIAGDFIFLPSDARLSKALSSSDGSNRSLLLFVRVRFFLPKGSDMSSHAQHGLYLQVRRSLLEHQLPCPFRTIIELAGLALQAEFGNFSEKEHGSRDYFLLEHYVPETMSCATKDTDRLKRELIDAHISRRGLNREKAEQIFISLAQTLPHYGGHFYTAAWVLKDNAISHYPIRQPEQRPVWLRVSAQGIGLYERGASTTASPGGPIAYTHFGWRAIRTLCYSKRYLCILPHRDGDESEQKQLKKYKLRMEHNKSYFAFRLASLHHQFFLRLRTEYDSLPSLSRLFGVPLKSLKDDDNSLRRLQSTYRSDQENVNDGTVNAGTEFNIKFRSSSRTDVLKTGLWHYKSIEDCKRLNQSINEERQNDENEMSNQDPSAFQSREIKACSVLTSSSNNVTPLCSFELRADETLGNSLAARLQDASFIDGERRLTAIRLRHKDGDRGLGIRIAAGEDGGAYIAAVMLQQFGVRDIGPGDQVVAVNGTSLLGMPYERAVQLLQDACKEEVELVIATERPSITWDLPSEGGISNSGSCHSAEEKHVSENCRDVENFKKHPPAPPLSVPYHKHTRYEIETDLHCADTVTTHMKKRMEESLGRNISRIQNIKIDEISHCYGAGLPLTKVYSKSCSNLTQSNTVMVVDMIKKQHAEHDALDNKQREAFTKVSVPRSLGTSRKWRGPVRYPVTPVRKTMTEATSGTTKEYNVHFHDGHCDCSSSSEDEQYDTI